MGDFWCSMEFLKTLRYTNGGSQWLSHPRPPICHRSLKALAVRIEMGMSCVTTYPSVSTINKQFHGDVMGRNGYVLSTGTHRMGNHQWQTPCGFVTQGFTSNMKPHLGGEKGVFKVIVILNTAVPSQGFEAMLIVRLRLWLKRAYIDNLGVTPWNDKLEQLVYDGFLKCSYPQIIHSLDHLLVLKQPWCLGDAPMT